MRDAHRLIKLMFIMATAASRLTTLAAHSPSVVSAVVCTTRGAAQARPRAPQTLPLHLIPHLTLHLTSSNTATARGLSVIVDCARKAKRLQKLLARAWHAREECQTNVCSLGKSARSQRCLGSSRSQSRIRARRRHNSLWWHRVEGFEA